MRDAVDGRLPDGVVISWTGLGFTIYFGHESGILAVARMHGLLPSGGKQILPAGYMHQGKGRGWYDFDDGASFAEQRGVECCAHGIPIPKEWPQKTWRGWRLVIAPEHLKRPT